MIERPESVIFTRQICDRLAESIAWESHALGDRRSWPATLSFALDLLFHSPEPMIVVWGESNFLFYNDGFLPKLEPGLHPSVMGKSCEEIWPTLNSSQQRGDTSKLVELFSRLHPEMTFAKSPLFHEGKPCGSLLISHPRRAYDFRRSEEQLQLAAEASGIGLWYLDLETRALERNDRHDRIFSPDQPIEEWSFETFLSYVFPEDRMHVSQAMLKAIQTDRAFDFETRFVRSDGQLRWLAVNGHVILNADGTPTKQLVGANTDITDRIKQAEDLKAAKIEAENANKMKSAFLANMSHEIRTPLGVILGFSDLILDPTLPLEEKLQYSAVLRRNGEQLNSLINDILDLSKVESGQLHIEVFNFVIHSLIEDTANALGPRAQEKGLKLIFETDLAAFPILSSDPNRVRQILFNLVGNSIKFTSVGEIRVKVRHDGVLCVFEVSDTGIGIDEAHRSLLFKNFAQADESITRKYGGTGLGLALSKRLAELLGGDLRLSESRVGIGSSFEFSIFNNLAIAPSKSPESAPNDSVEVIVSRPRPSASTSGESLSGVSVLLVEDSPDNQKLLTRILTTRGASVDIASDGRSGLAAALNGRHDIVLMDVQMPILDGYSATQSLRGAGYSTPIIALTAHAMAEVKEKCLRVGYTDFLTKPVNSADLVQAIRRHLDAATALRSSN